MKPGIFGSILARKPRYNAFDLSHEKKMSLKMGNLYPILLEEIVPGDKFRVNSEIMMRMAPMIVPMMHRVDVFVHYFFVPNRIIWDEWETFYTGGEDGLQDPGYPTITIDDAQKVWFPKGRVNDYLGIPVPDPNVAITNPLTISALPFRAYVKIWEEYYRDQNLTPKAAITWGSTVPTGEYGSLTSIRKRTWEKDYLTSALPWTQRGQEVTLPVEFNYKDESEVYNQLGAQAAVKTGLSTGPLGGNDGRLITDLGVDPQLDLLRIENLEDNASSVTINELRTAVRLQEFLERNARTGSRYIEQLFSRFFVRSSDQRLQRPEYLGGGKTPINVSEVLNTVGDPSTNPQGYMAGHGISIGNSNRFSRKFEEHGYIMGIMSVLPRTAYQQAVNKLWTKFDRYDLYAPEFAQLGEQEVKMKEVFHNWQGAAGQGELTFGYQHRFSEYKYKQSEVAGDFRSVPSGSPETTLDFWHMARWFDSEPTLNSDFVNSNPTNRIFNVVDQDIDNLYAIIFNNVKALRNMPYFNVPTL